MYIVEGYPEFDQDVKEIWKHFILENNFEVVKIDDGAVVIKNEKCIIKLLLDIEQRIYYKFQNPKTLKVTDFITLATYLGKEPFSTLLGGEKYPLTMDEWIDFYANDNYSSICRVDLPIILNEIRKNFQFVIDGDFSWEKNWDKWKEWYNANRKSRIPYQHRELSYECFLKDKENKS